MYLSQLVVEMFELGAFKTQDTSIGGGSVERVVHDDCIQVVEADVGGGAFEDSVEVDGVGAETDAGWELGGVA